MKKIIVLTGLLIVNFLIMSFHDLYVEEAQLYTLSAGKVTLTDKHNNKITIDPVILYGSNRQLDIEPDDIELDQAWEKIYTLKFKSNITTTIYQSDQLNSEGFLTFQDQAVIAIMRIRYFGVTETTSIKLQQSFYNNLDNLNWSSYE